MWWVRNPPGRTEAVAVARAPQEPKEKVMRFTIIVNALTNLLPLVLPDDASIKDVIRALTR
ncbi:hypothetical protein RAJCM14343_3750 [Rhodococcus aetherivorans]|uniref:Uncharacterized protein n=1 Tax=Rhodococcus aetherivorans TaxID=191292 RepID=A0ABQ0YPH1_9NOCA|nr:hypothetical protein RAJCM14343_3750 [Rhodococcus aetherivorans]CCW12713.1 hypothetical protein EBESD8_32650 [Rhodococcus aetherivorans]